MATNLDIDPALVETALKVSGERTKKAAVTRALKEFVARRKQKRLPELVGKLAGTKASTTRRSAAAIEPVRRHKRLVARLQTRHATGRIRSWGFGARARDGRNGSDKRHCAAGTASGVFRSEESPGDHRALFCPRFSFLTETITSTPLNCAIFACARAFGWGQSRRCLHNSASATTSRCLQPMTTIGTWQSGLR